MNKDANYDLFNKYSYITEHLELTANKIIELNKRINSAINEQVEFDLKEEINELLLLKEEYERKLEMIKQQL